MNDIEQKALALVNEIEREEGENELTRRIMHEKTKQELADCKQELSDFRQYVSDAVMAYFGEGPQYVPHDIELAQFIIPAAKPDPLVKIMEALDGEWTPDEYAKEIRAALDARGLEIREKNDDQ